MRVLSMSMMMFMLMVMSAAKKQQARRYVELYGDLDGFYGYRDPYARRYRHGMDPLRAELFWNEFESGRFGRGRLVDHLLGKTKDPSDFEAGLTTFGIGQDRSATAWRDLVDQLLFEGLLREDPNDNRPLIGLGDPDGVRAVYRGERRVSVRKAAPGAERKAPGRRRSPR